MPLLRPGIPREHPCPQESGVAWVAKVLVWALGVLFRVPILNYDRVNSEPWCQKSVLKLPFLGPVILRGHTCPREFGVILEAQVLVLALGALFRVLFHTIILSTQRPDARKRCKYCPFWGRRFRGDTRVLKNPVSPGWHMSKFGRSAPCLKSLFNTMIG